MNKFFVDLSNRLAINKPINRTRDVWFRALKVSGLMAIIIASGISIFFKTQVVPNVQNNVFPVIVSAWPEGQTARISKQDGMTTESGAPIVVKLYGQKVLFDPTIEDVSFEKLNKMKVDILVSGSYFYTINKDKKIEGTPLAELTDKLESPFVINKASISWLFNEISKHVFVATIVILLVSSISLFVYLFVHMLFVVLVVSLIIFILSKLMKSRNPNISNLSWTNIFLTTFQFVIWGLILMIVSVFLLIPISTMMFWGTLILSLNWFAREYLNWFKKEEIAVVDNNENL